MTAAEDEAYSQAGTITADINAGVDAGNGLAASSVIVLADGRWASPQGSFNDFTPDLSRPFTYLPPAPDRPCATARRGDGPAFTAGISGPAPVRGSEIHLGRITRNLLDNAARHARTEVTATVTVSGEDVVLTVTDDGPGIPIADRERIFDRFVRLDDARDRTGGGTGLGLAIVRDLVGSLGGTVIAADSPAGARFVVRLPGHDDAPALVPLPPSRTVRTV